MAISIMPARSSASCTCENSATPLSARKHLKASTPSSNSSRSPPGPALPGTTPPHSATSTRAFSSSARTFARRPSSVVVGGMLLSGMSTSVVTPPAAAARVAVAKPSHSVRPGSLMWTCVSTSPGEHGEVAGVDRDGTPAGAGSSRSVIATITPSRDVDRRGPLPWGVTTRLPRIDRIDSRHLGRRA